MRALGSFLRNPYLLLVAAALAWWAVSASNHATSQKHLACPPNCSVCESVSAQARERLDAYLTNLGYMEPSLAPAS